MIFSYQMRRTEGKKLLDKNKNYQVFITLQSKAISKDAHNLFCEYK